MKGSRQIARCQVCEVRGTVAEANDPKADSTGTGLKDGSKDWTEDRAKDGAKEAKDEAKPPEAQAEADDELKDPATVDPVAEGRTNDGAAKGGPEGTEAGKEGFTGAKEIKEAEETLAEDGAKDVPLKSSEVPAQQAEDSEAEFN